MISDYKVTKSNKVKHGTFGIFRIGKTKEYGMVVESSSKDRNDVLILYKDRVSITQSNLDMLVVSDLSIKPIVEPDTIEFEDHTIFHGAIRILGDTIKMVASDGTYTKLVDLPTGKTEHVHDYEALMITKWSLIKSLANGAEQELLASPDIVKAI